MLHIRAFMPLMLVLLALGCDRAVNITNKSPKAVTVFVSIPEMTGRSSVRLDPGQDGSAELGDSGIYTAYVLSDDVVTGAMSKVRDDLEQQLAAATDPAQVQKLTDQLAAVKKFYDQLQNRATSCAGHVQDQGADAYVTVTWDDTTQKFVATCVSTAPATNPSGDGSGSP